MAEGSAGPTRPDLDALFSRPPSVEPQGHGELAALLSNAVRPGSLYDGSSGRTKLRDEEGQEAHRTAWQRRRTQWRAARQRTRYYIPILEWLPNYSLSLLAGDVTAALTLTCLLVPQSMSYASSLARLNPVNGLFGAAIPCAVYALLGTSGQLSLGPEAALSLMTGETIASILSSLPLEAGSLAKHHQVSNGFILSVSSLICFEVGLVTFLLGILRLGFLDAVLSRPLLRGFVTAVGVVIIVSQMIPMLGLTELEIALHVDHGTTFEKFLFLLEHIWRAHRLTTIISIITLVVLFSARILKPRLAAKRAPWVRLVPDVMLVVIVSTALAGYFRWDKAGVAILGHVSAGHVKMHNPLTLSRSYFQETIGTAVTIAVMGYVDSIVAAKENASRFNHSISPNRELVALGAANIAASTVSGSLVGFGSITRSRLNANAGARTPMASLLTSAFILLTTFFLLKYLYFLPKATLACIVTMVVYSILVELPHDVHFFWKLRAYHDLALMLVTFALTVFWNLKVGIVVSIAISLIMVVAQSSQVSIKIMGRIPGTHSWESIDEENETDEEIPGVLIVRVRALTFANAGMLKERLRRLERYGAKKHHPSDAPTRGEASFIVFHMGDVEAMDPPALQVLHEVVAAYVDRHVPCLFCHLSVEQRRLFDRAGITDLVGQDAFQDSVNHALGHLSSR